MGHSTGGFTSRQIAADFLARTNSVDVVFLVTIEKRNPYSLGLKDFVVNWDIVVTSESLRKKRLTNEALASISKLMEQVVSHLPTPMVDACNAVHRCELDGYGYGCNGGYTMSGDVIKVSSREVIEVLAGIKQPGTRNWDGVLEENRIERFFAMKLTEGKMLTSVSVIDNGDHDDDWLEFTFRNDPAISPFK